jgi:hypothetical protein
MCPRIAKKANMKKLKTIFDEESVALVVLEVFPPGPPGPGVTGEHETGHELSPVQSAHLPSFNIFP